MKIIFFFLSFILLYANCFAQTNINLQWQKIYGGSAGEVAWNVQQTTDGGYIIAGATASIDSNITGNHGYGDFWIVKTDPSGSVLWQRCYGGSSYDEAYMIKQTTDGGYIIAGTTNSNDGDVTGNHGSKDIWIVKIDPSGILQWQKCYGGSDIEEVNSIQQTPGGGYIFAGWTQSDDGDITGKHYGHDSWVVKISQTGVIEWRKCYGGSENESTYNIQKTIDGGFVMMCFSSSNDGDVTINHGMADYWLVKLDSSGIIQWQKSYGGSGEEIPWGGGQQTTDGGYIICGATQSNDGEVIGNHGSFDYWVVKTDPVGTIQWKKCYGGSGFDQAWDMQQTADGGYILCGESQSQDFDVTGNHGAGDYWVVKIDSTGTIQWQKSCGGSNYDYAYSIRQTLLGTFIVAGSTLSEDGDVTGNHGFIDIWVAMLCNNDPLSISIADTSYCYTAQLTATAGFASYLWSTGDTSQTIDVHTGGSYHLSAINLAGCPSQTDIVVPHPVQPYEGEQLCMVTIDSLTGKNVIVIEKTLNVGTDSVHLYRMDNINSLYKLIGSIGMNESGVLTDNTAIPAQQSYQYKISVKDTCGRESELSAVHRTILLQANSGINHEVNLYWNPYEGFAYSNFEIYRNTALRGEFILIANVPNTTYAFTDLDPPSGTNLYQVRVTKESPCVPVRSQYSHVSSNIITSSNIGIDENQVSSFTAHPNPVYDILTLELLGLSGSTFFSVFNVNGQALIIKQITAHRTEIDLSGLPAGVYFIQLRNDKTAEVGKIIKE